MVVRANLHLLIRVAFPRTIMSRRQWTHTPARALHTPVPPPPQLVPEPPLHLLPSNTRVPGPELAIPGYVFSTHVFPAAWPRSTPFIPLPDDPQEKRGSVVESKEERKARLARVMDTMLAIKAARERGQGDVLDDSGRVLWMTATRWVRTAPSSGAGDKTLLCTHANGLHGTTYAPVLRRLLAQRQDVAEIWALDSVQHGDAALLNAGKIGILYEWNEMARDALCFLQHFLPSKLDPTPLPTLLPRVSGGSRKVFALGHSFGGCSLVLAACYKPELFSALMLADAVVLPVDADRTTATSDGTVHTSNRSIPVLVAGALSRRSRWASRAAAYKALAANPFFGSWDKEVLDIYVKYALVEEESGEVRLKCEGISEAAVFAEARASGEAWSAVSALDERVSLLWINPPAEASMVKTQDIASARVRLRASNSAHVLIPDGTHLIVQTHPHQVADAAQAFLHLVNAGAVGDVHELKLQCPEDTTTSQQGSRARL
ncbi:alpha/beta-hydrolase [Peniophora sp. CONT]|nr:alpha/beta-hydrolase [Peniophora sp. CONT]